MSKTRTRLTLVKILKILESSKATNLGTLSLELNISIQTLYGWKIEQPTKWMFCVDKIMNNLRDLASANPRVTPEYAARRLLLWENKLDNLDVRRVDQNIIKNSDEVKAVEIEIVENKVHEPKN